MQYKVEEIEEQLLQVLLANAAVTDGHVSVATHTGGVSPLLFGDPKYREGFKAQLPFIMVQYQGKRPTDSSSDREMVTHELRFRFFIGCRSLRSTRESTLGAYELLRNIYDEIHGKFIRNPNSYLSPQFDVGEGCETVNSMSPFIESPGVNEQLLVNMDGIVVYQADYIVQVLA